MSRPNSFAICRERIMVSSSSALDSFHLLMSISRALRYTRLISLSGLRLTFFICKGTSCPVSVTTPMS